MPGRDPGSGTLRDRGGRPGVSPALVSVLLPCRDAAPWLDECLDSLFAQTLRDFEVIAVDDGSRDGTRALLERRARAESRLTLLDSRGAGLVPALNLAAAAARGPLLARMDADDICSPERLAAQRDHMEQNPDIAACGTGIRLFPEHGIGPGYRRYEAWLNSLSSAQELNADLFVECPIAHPSLMIRRSVLHGLGGYRDAGWPEDYDLLLRLHAVGMRAVNLPRALLHWRVRSDRHSLRSERYSAAAFRRCKVHFLEASFLPPGRPIVVWGAGKVGKPLARELIRHGMPVTAFVDLDPRKLGQEVHGAPVLSPAGFAQTISEADPYVLAAVGSAGAREDIRNALRDMGRRELLDFRMCA
jgi:glycosyltransferase involved in cell wall biosynthesis